MSGNRLFTSNDVELKGSIVRKRTRSQQSQISLEDERDSKARLEGAASLNSLPSDIIEKILSHFTYKKMLDFRLVSRRWNFAISDYIVHSQIAFKHYLEKFQIEWINLSTNCEEMIRNNNDNPHEVIERCSPFKLPPRFNQNALYYSGFMYIFGGVVSNQTAFNDLWRFDLQRKKWQRIIVNGDIPPPKIWTALHFYEFLDPVTGLKKPSFVQMGHFSLFSPNTFNVTQERQFEQQEYSLIYVFDIETLTWRKLPQNGCLRISLTGKFSSLITGNELLILCGAVTTGTETLSENNGHAKSVVYSFDLKTSVWSIQKATQSTMTRSQFDSMIPLNEHSILFHHQRKLFIFERNRCYSCDKCLEKRRSLQNFELEIMPNEMKQEDEIVWTCSKCDIVTSEGDMRLFFNAKSAVYFQIDKYKFGAVLLRQIRLTLPPPPPIVSSLGPMKLSTGCRLPFGLRGGERIAILDRYMDKINHQLGRQNERLTEILDIEFFDARHLLRDRILRPICDQTTKNQSSGTKLFSCFAGITFGSNYLPTVTLTPEGLLIFGGSQPFDSTSSSSQSTSIGAQNSVPSRSDFYMLIGRPNLNRLTSQMDYK